ncbi:MAG: RDD family protein [Dehalococcoidia bacterium]|nr:RDD family protein [Dehalococcoidia bacterium]MYI85850.1 RDD family protein [Dehalococcoidia bacterium]
MQGESETVCRSCAQPNDPDSKFCGECGGRLGGGCARCGQENDPEAKFCTGCGYGLFGGEGRPGPDDPDEDAWAFSGSLCPRCLRLSEPESQFCYYCGLSLTEETIRAGRRASRAFQQGAPGGFWNRVVAFAIDGAVLAIIATLIFVAFGARTHGFFREDTPGVILASVVSATVLALYSSTLIKVWGTTVGKRAFDLYVLRSDGGRCGFWRSFGRQVASGVSLLLVGVGYLMVAFRADNRGLHDLIAGTAVIKR